MGGFFIVFCKRLPGRVLGPFHIYVRLLGMSRTKELCNHMPLLQTLPEGDSDSTDYGPVEIVSFPMKNGWIFQFAM